MSAERPSGPHLHENIKEFHSPIDAEKKASAKIRAEGVKHNPEGKKFTDRLKGIERSERPLLDGRKREIGVERIRRRKVKEAGGTMMEERVEMCDRSGEDVRAVKTTIYDKDSGKFARFSRETPDGKPIVKAERSGSRIHVEQYNPWKTEGEVTAEKTFNDSGDLEMSREHTYGNHEIATGEGAPQRTHLRDRSSERQFENGKEVGTSNTSYEYDGRGRITSEKTTELHGSETASKRKRTDKSKQYSYEGDSQQITAKTTEYPGANEYMNMAHTWPDSTSERVSTVKDGLVIEEITTEYEYEYPPMNSDAIKERAQKMGGNFESGTRQRQDQDGKPIYVDQLRRKLMEQRSSYGYDDNGRMTSESIQSGSFLVDRRYTYGNTDQPTGVVARGANSSTEKIYRLRTDKDPEVRSKFDPKEKDPLNPDARIYILDSEREIVKDAA